MPVARNLSGGFLALMYVGTLAQDAKGHSVLQRPPTLTLLQASLSVGLERIYRASAVCGHDSVCFPNCTPSRCVLDALMTIS